MAVGKWLMAGAARHSKIIKEGGTNKKANQKDNEKYFDRNDAVDAEH